MIDFVKQNYPTEEEENPGLNFLSIIKEEAREQTKPVVESTQVKTSTVSDTTSTNDGTTVSWTTTADGEQKPTKAEFANKSTCTYDYSKSGALEKAVVQDETGREICKVSLKGKEYIFERGGKEIVKVDASRVTVNADGSLEIKPENFPRKNIRIAQGKLEIEVQLSPTSKPARREESLTSSGEVKGYETGKNGSELLKFQSFPNGRVLTYGYEEKDGKAIVQSITDELGDTHLLYRKSTGSDKWTCNGKQNGERITDNVGKIRLSDNYLPTFEPFLDRTVEVSAKPNAQRVELQGAIAMQQRCRETLKQIVETMFVPEKAAIEKAFIEQVIKKEGELEKLTPERRDELAREMNKKTSAAFDLKFESIKKELDLETKKLQESSNLEKVWPALNTTKACIKGLNQWVDTAVVPLAMRANARNGGQLDANSPIPTPKHPKSDQFVAAAYLNGRDIADFGGKIPPLFQSDKIPSAAEIQQLERKLKWCEDNLKRDREQRVKFELTVVLPDLAKEYGLPTRAFSEVCANDEAKLARLRTRMELQIEVKELAHSIFAVRESHKDLNIKLPPNCQIVKGEDGREKLSFSWTDNENINGQGNRNQDKQLAEWLRTEAPKFNKIMQQYAETINVANKRIMYGDLPGKGFASFDNEGRFDAVHDENGEGRKEINLLSGGFKVEEKDGKFVVDVTWQPKRSEIYNYLDMGAEKIGKESVKRLGPFGPNEPVAVFDSHGEIRILPAKELSDWKQGQAAKYWGLKVATGLIDASMVAGAVATGGTALLGGRAGLRVLMGAVTRGTLGVTGLIGNNAKVMSDSAGQDFHKVRSICMLADVSHGLLSSGVRAVKGTKAASEVTLKGLKALEEAPRLYKIPVKLAVAATDNKVHHATMFATNLFFLPVVGGDIKHQIEKMSKPKDKTSEVALGKALNKPEPADHKKVVERMQEQESQETKLKVSENYFEMILSQDKLTEPQRKKILELAEKVTGIVKGEMPKDLVEGDESDCKKLELARKTARKNYNMDLLESLSNGDESVRLAAAVGLLVLNYSDEVSKADPNDKAMITLDGLISRLERAQVSTKPNDRIVATDALVRLTGQTDKTPFDNARVWMDAFNDPKADAHTKAYAVVNLAQFAKVTELLEPSMLAGMSPVEQANYRERSAGNSPADVIRFLKNLSVDKNVSADLRTLSAKSLDIIVGDEGIEEIGVVAKLLSVEEKRCVDSMKLGTNSTYTTEVLEQTEWQLQMDDIDEQLKAIKVRTSLLAPDNSKDVLALNNHIIKLFQDGISDETKIDSTTISDAIRLLNLDNPKNLDDESRKALLVFLERPTTSETKNIKLAILERAKQLVETDEQRSLIKKVLPVIINPQLGNSLYAKNSPELRLAAVEAIKSLGLKDTEVKNTLLKVAAPETKENNLFEGDARVRLAALITLKDFGGRDFDTAIDNTIASETDVAVRAFAEHTKLKIHRPVRDLMYFQNRDLFAGEIEANQDHNYANGELFLKVIEPTLSAMPLNVKTEIKEYEEKVVPDNDIAGKGTRVIRTGPFEREIEIENPARKTFLQKEIIQTAINGGKNQDLAIQALFFIAMKKPHGVLANPSEAKFLYGKAVDTLCGLSEPGSGARMATLTRMKSVVASPEIDPELRLRFLQAIDKSVNSENETRNPGLKAALLDKHAKFLADVLTVDLGLNANQPDKDHRDLQARTKFREYILERTREYRSPYALPTLDGISVNKRSLNGVREKAETLLADLRDSVAFRFQNSTLGNGTAEEATASAREMNNAILNPKTLDQTVNAIINGSSIKPILAEDPRIAPIKQALKCKSESKHSPAALSANAHDKTISVRDENGSEMVRLAAALVILQPRNTAFTASDKLEALRVCTQLAWDGCEFGYRRDAKQLLEAEIKTGNPLALDALADIALSGKGSFKAAQSLLLDSLKSDRVESKLPDGRTLVMRKWSGQLVVEEFNQDKLLRTATSGRPYSDMITEEMWNAKTPEKRFEIARKLLGDETPEALYATDNQRREALLLIKNMSQSNDLVKTSSEFRFACARYIAGTTGINAKIGEEFKRDVLKSMVDLASNNDRSAMDYLATLPPSMTAPALEELLRRQPTVAKISDSMEENNRKELERALKVLNSEKDRKDMIAFYNSRLANTQKIDVVKMAAWAETAGKIIESSNQSTPATDALHIAIYLEAATHLGCDHPSVKKLNVEKCLERLEKTPSPLTVSAVKSVEDPRLILAKPTKASDIPSMKEIDLSTKLAVSVNNAKNCKDPKVVEQYARVLDALAPKAVAVSLPGFFKDYAEVKARTGGAEEAFDQIGETIAEDLIRFPIHTNKDLKFVPSPQRASSLMEAILKPVMMQQAQQKEIADQARLTAIRSFLEHAPLTSQMKLADSLVDSDQLSLRKAGYAAVTRCLESKDPGLRKQANELLEKAYKSSPAQANDAFEALLDTAKTDDGFKWMIKMSDRSDNPKIKEQIEIYKKSIKR
jgi:hypothetical protein